MRLAVYGIDDLSTTLAQALRMETPNTVAREREKVVCRAVEAADVPDVIALLSEGFPERGRDYWTRGFERLRDRPLPEGCPRYGYLLRAGSEIVGCLLLIVSLDCVSGTLRANVSSWYAKPNFRSLAAMLVSVAFKRKDFTFINISPAPHTVPILEAQGYKRYAAGQFIALPALTLSAFRTRVRPIDKVGESVILPHEERALLERHVGYGALSLVCSTGDDHQPFVFLRRRLLGGRLPAAQLMWCRDVTAFQHVAGALGRCLLRHGIAAVSIDANGPLANLLGTYREGSGVKFYRGPNAPRLGDLADTEMAVFGV